MVLLESELELKCNGRAETRTSWEDCVGSGSVVKRFFGLNSLTMPWATSSILSKPESVKLA